LQVTDTGKVMIEGGYRQAVHLGRGGYPFFGATQWHLPRHAAFL
jgi:hypothetical protein